MELVDYFKGFRHIYDEFFDIPYRITMGKVKEEYWKIFCELPSLMNGLYCDIEESKVCGKTIIYDRSSGSEVKEEFKAALKIFPKISGEDFRISFGSIQSKVEPECLTILMDRDSVLIFSCYCIYLYLLYCSKVRSSEESAFLELCSKKIPNVFDEIKEIGFKIQFEDLFGMNYWRITSCNFVNSVVDVASSLLDGGMEK